jgi:hypothetical protein
MSGENDNLCQLVLSQYVLPEDGDRIQSRKSFKWTETWIMSRTLIVVLTYNLHIDLTYYPSIYKRAELQTSHFLWLDVHLVSI